MADKLSPAGRLWTMRRSGQLGDLEPQQAVIGLFLIFGAMIAAFFPFFALFLSDKGLEPGQIGVVLAAMAAARIVANPAWGHLADTRYGRVFVLRAGLLAGGSAAVALYVADGIAAVATVAFVFAAANAAVGPNVDAIALTHLGDERMSEYSRLRGMESFSYAVACFIYGAVLQSVGVPWSLPIFAAFGFVMFGWSFTLRRDRAQRIDDGGRLGSLGAVFREAPRFPFYLFALLLVWSGFNAAWNFYSLRIEEAGGGPFLVGMGAALGGLVEVPVMFAVSRFHRSIGLRKTWAAGTVVYFVGFNLWGMVDDPRIISLLTVFEGVGFGLLFTSGVVIVGKLVPKSLYSTGQSVAVMVGFGVAPIIGAGIGGVVFGSLGPTWLFSMAGMAVLTGGLFGWFALSEPVFTNGLAHVQEPLPPADVV
jgi:PPP family 3-phenylpropionic acid transporter